MNLLLNAIDFMPEGGVLRVAASQHQDHLAGATKKWLRFRISDSGKGIPPALLEHLFDPFVSGREEGIGLGLSITPQIVYRHGGRMEATNNPECGATFVVSLPLDDVGQRMESEWQPVSV